MGEQALQLIKVHLDDDHLSLFANRLTEWLVADLNRSEEGVAAFTESRAKALLRASGFVDDPTLNDFARMMEGSTAVRLALHDLLDSTTLAENNEVQALATTSNAAEITPVSSPPSPRDVLIAHPLTYLITHTGPHQTWRCCPGAWRIGSGF
jgi:hypothetical protein